jgi:hypothetical protein
LVPGAPEKQIPCGNDRKKNVFLVVIPAGDLLHVFAFLVVTLAGGLLHGVAFLVVIPVGDLLHSPPVLAISISPAKRLPESVDFYFAMERALGPGST